MSKARPRVFIGSSSEGLLVAEAIQINLDHDCETVLWRQGVFAPSEGTLEALEKKLNEFDFAILVLTPDDLVTTRGIVIETPRDNVLLELGMFIGALGRHRSFVVFDRGVDIKLPSDLAGVTLTSYQSPATPQNLLAALGAACAAIKSVVQRIGERVPDQDPTERSSAATTSSQAKDRAVVVPLDTIPFIVDENEVVRLIGKGIAGSVITAVVEGRAQVITDCGITEMVKGRSIIGSGNREFEIKPTGRGVIRAVIMSTPPTGDKPTVTAYQFEVR